MSIAFAGVDGNLNVASVDPQNVHAMDFLSGTTGYSSNKVFAPKRQTDT